MWCPVCTEVLHVESETETFSADLLALARVIDGGDA